MDVLNAASLYLGFFAGVFASIWFAFSKFANFKTALLLGFSSVSRDIDRAISAKIEALAESHGCLAKHWNALNIDAPVERWKFLTPFTEEPFTIDAETEIFALLDEQSVLHTRLTVHTLSAIEAINNHSIAIADAEKSLRGKEIALRELKKLDSLCTQQELFESIASVNTTGLADVAEAHRLRIGEPKRAAFGLPNQSPHQTETR